MIFFEKYKSEIIIIVIAGIFFMPFLGGVHLFDWDEINFAEIAREMIILKDYLRIHINFKPYFEKPPFFFWLQAISMHLFGVGEYAARFPNAVCGVLSLLFIFKIGKKLYNELFGWIWVLAYFGSILSHIYFKSGIIDPYFNLFIFAGIYFLILFHWKKNKYDLSLSHSAYYYLLWAGIATGLGVLTKGPVAYLVTCMVLGVYWIFQRFKFYINAAEFLIYTFTLSVVVFLWLGVEIAFNGTVFIKEFLIRNYELFIQPDAGHKGFVGYHFVVLLFGMFPASLFCIRGFFKISQDTAYQKDFRVFMIILFSVVLLLFSIVKSKIVHYSSLTYFPLTYLAALVMYQLSQRKVFFDSYLRGSILIIGVLLGSLLVAFPFLAMNIELLKATTTDEFALANMDANVSWSGLEAIVGLVLVFSVGIGIYLLNKKIWLNGFVVLFGGTAITVQLVTFVFLNKIETYSQRAAIEFFKDLKNKDCYIHNLHYKSYAQLFYTDKQVPTNKNSLEENWLLQADLDKDLYIITKVNEVQSSIERVPDMRRIGDKNGFVFFIREAKRKD